MTEQKAIKIATQFQLERQKSTEIVGVRRVDQAFIDELVESYGKPIPSDWPKWMQPLPHWSVRFDRENPCSPRADVVLVYDDGTFVERPGFGEDDAFS